MIPSAAHLGSRPARNTRESAFGQRADSNFKEIIDKRGVLVDVKYNKSKCRACGEEGTVYNSENDLKICLACSVIQNSGVPEGEKASNREIKRQLEQFKASLTTNE
jgi:hypothetical protein